jgi:predicted TIM-barrel fold metal-dependent hydrolase
MSPTAYLESRSALPWFDVNCWIGEKSPMTGERPDTLPALMDGLVAFDIRRAVVSHVMSRDYDPRLGNEEALKAVEGATNAYAAIVVTPAATGEMGEVEQTLAAAIARGARMARIFPLSQTFSTAEWCFGSTLAALEAHRLPLCVWHSQLSWDAIVALAQQHPSLPVIVEGTGRKLLYDSRLFYPALTACPNLHLEIHNLVNHLGVDDLVRRFGPERLLYGSGYPIYDPNTAMALVTHGNFDDAARRLIAGGNLERLLAEVR